ncbi:MAG: insulinase family protein [Candidatus Aminicenantes bacterium]|nr:insulinase family protein [Candidatus Aminicenantes bacterium]
MYLKNSGNRVPGLVFTAWLVFAFAHGLLPAQTQDTTYRFTSSKGLGLQVIPQPQSRLCVAELVVLTPYKGTYPGISQITYENLFNPLLADGHNSLLTALNRLGGDFNVINGGDHARIQVTFLPDKLGAFIQFIEKLFTFNDFSQNRFKSSTLYFGTRMRRTQDWEAQVVHQLAYRHLFPDHPLGFSLVSRDALTRSRLAHVVTYFRRNFRLSHATLIVKGDIKPYVTFGLVEKAFNNYRRDETPLSVEDPRNFPSGDVILFHTGKNSPMTMFWFKVIPPVNSDAHMATLVTEKILFGMPLGVVFQRAALSGLGNIRIETDIQDHCHFSVISNTISRLQAENISRFFMLARSERRKLALQNVDRKQFLYAVNYLYSRFKVNSAAFANDLRLKTLEKLCDVDIRHSKVDRNNFQHIFQQVSLEQINRLLRNQARERRDDSQSLVLGDVIVITGDADQIAPHLKMFSVKKYQPDW